jgi:hypothetical protein
MTHLTEPELYDLLDSPDSVIHNAHLAVCSDCRQELHTLRLSLTLLREATTSFTASHAPAFLLRQAPAPKTAFLPRRLAIASWAAAGILVAAGALGLSNLHQSPMPAAPVVTVPSASDEALLQSISDEIDQPVPSSLQVLASPTGQSSNSSTRSERKN